MSKIKDCFSSDVAMLMKVALDASVNPHERIVAACRLYGIEWKLAARASNIPTLPGVYIFYDFQDIFYIGKSIALRHRISGHNYKRGGQIVYALMPSDLIALREIQLIGILLPLFNRETSGLSEEFRNRGGL